MNSNNTWMTFFLVFLIIAFIYYSILFILNRRKLLIHISKMVDVPGISRMKTTQDLFPELIDRPINNLNQNSATLEKDDINEGFFEMLDEEDNKLLKEAENVVAEIQDTVNHVASLPPSHEEVYSKIKSIVGQYKVFENTEYFEAINNFIQITVERDCSIKFSNEELLMLWV